MKNIFKFSTAALLCLAMLGLGSCRSIQELDTDQYSLDQVVLSAYGPNPVYRDGTISFIGSNLDKVTSVEVPGIDPITTIEVVKSGKNSEIKIQLTNTTEAVGRITLVTKDGVKISTKSDITYTEPIVFDDFSPKEAMPGDVITIKGDYMNLVQEVIFTDNVIVAGDALTKTRKELKVTVPFNAITGTIAVGDVDQILNPEAFANTKVSKDNLVIGDPTVTANAAATLKAGAEITVAGKYLNMIKSVEFDGATAISLLVEENGTKITFNLPDEAKDGEYNLVSFAGKSFKGGEFTSVKPSELAAAPQPVKAGQELTITGNDLDLVTKVEVPDAGEVVAVNEGSIKFTMPAAATEGDVTLTMANGSTVTTPFTLVVPTITSVSPLEIYAGDEIDVVGTDLDLVTAVTLGGKEVSFAMAQDGTALKLTTAATSVTGKVEIALANGVTVASTDEVTVNYHSKVIVTSRPAAEHIGQPVSIEGTNLKLVENIFIGDTKVTDYVLRTDAQVVFNMPWCKAGSYPLSFYLYDGDVEVQADPIEVQLELAITTIAEGEFIADAWGNQPYIGPDEGGVQFGIKAGDVLRLYFAPIREEEGWKLQVVEGHWGPTYLSVCSKGEDTEGGKFTEIEYKGYIDLSVTADMATAFSTKGWWGGLILLNGNNVKGTKLVMMREISQETTLWEGEAIATGWSNQPYLLSDAGGELKDANAQAGQQVRFYITPLDDGAWKCQIVEGHWGPTYCSYCSVGGDTESGKFTEWDLSAHGGYISITLTEEMLTAAYTQQWWGGTFVANGDKTKITKITLF